MWGKFISVALSCGNYTDCRAKSRPPLSWLGVVVGELTVGFRPQLHATTAIAAQTVDMTMGFRAFAKAMVVMQHQRIHVTAAVAAQTESAAIVANANSCGRKPTVKTKTSTLNHECGGRNRNVDSHSRVVLSQDDRYTRVTHQPLPLSWLWTRWVDLTTVSFRPQLHATTAIAAQTVDLTMGFRDIANAMVVMQHPRIHATAAIAAQTESATIVANANSCGRKPTVKTKTSTLNHECGGRNHNLDSHRVLDDQHPDSAKSTSKNELIFPRQYFQFSDSNFQLPHFSSKRVA